MRLTACLEAALLAASEASALEAMGKIATLCVDAGRMAAVIDLIGRKGEGP